MPYMAITPIGSLLPYNRRLKRAGGRPWTSRTTAS